MSDSRKRSYEDEGNYQNKKERISGKVIKILCPYYCTGAVIGTKGASINQIKEESGTNIQVSKGSARFPRTEERVISISGELEGSMKVVAFVQEKIRTEKPSPLAKGVKFDRVDGRKRICKIVVSDQSTGKLIGKGGANVNKLKNEHNVKIHIMKPDEAIPGLNERIVSVEGEDKDVDKCIEEIIADIYTDDKGALEYKLDYSQFYDSFNQGQGWDNNRNSRYGDNGSGRYEGNYSRNQDNAYNPQGSYDRGYGGYHNQGGGYGNQGDNRGGYSNQYPSQSNSGYSNQMNNNHNPPYHNQGFGSNYSAGYNQAPANYSDNPGHGRSGYNANAGYGHPPQSQSYYGNY